MNPAYITDGYKIGHKQMYPKGTSFVFSNFTPRSTRRDKCDGVTWFGLQGFIKSYLIDYWNKNFFQKPKEEILKSYSRRINAYLGFEVETDHIAELHDLGYLPIEIMSLPEGSLVPYKVAPMVIFSNHKNFYWLPNFLETILSSYLWYPSTTATTARLFKQKMNEWAKKTGGNAQFVDFQGHNFGMRGTPGLEADCMADAAHLLFFKGTDTIPGIDYVEQYYNADCEKELIAMSVPATEHSISGLQILSNTNNYFAVEEEFNEVTKEWEVKSVLNEEEYRRRSE